MPTTRPSNFIAISNLELYSHQDVPENRHERSDSDMKLIGSEFAPGLAVSSKLRIDHPDLARCNSQGRYVRHCAYRSTGQVRKRLPQ